MKKIFTYAVAVFAIASCVNAQKSGFTKEALRANLLDSNETQISFKDILKKHQGKTVVIECWASWCSDCVKAMPKLKALQTDNPDVDYVFISMDKTAEKWKAGIEKHELTGDHYLATDGMKGIFGSAIKLDWIPRYIVVDKKGKVVLFRAIETDFETIQKTLNTLK